MHLWSMVFKVATYYKLSTNYRASSCDPVAAKYSGFVTAFSFYLTRDTKIKIGTKI